MQSRRGSFFEACLNVFIGFLTTLLVAPIIYKLCGMEVNSRQMTLATVYFTLFSVARSYAIRRIFNRFKAR
jgi:membrane protein implicated in regulation of membrane protease activity